MIFFQIIVFSGNLILGEVLEEFESWFKFDCLQVDAKYAI